jgi:anti-anti-sigma factor
MDLRLATSPRSGEHPASPTTAARYHPHVGIEDQLQVDAKRDQDRIVLRLKGELDLASVPLLQRELEAVDLKPASIVLLDLRELQFMDSTGLRAILAAHTRAEERGYDFAVTRGSDQVQRLLGITRVSEHLRIIDSPDEDIAIA